MVPSNGKTVAPYRNSVGPLQDKEYPTVGKTFQDLTNVMSKAFDIIEEMQVEQTESISLVKAAMEEATSLLETNGGVISSGLDQWSKYMAPSMITFIYTCNCNVLCN